MQKKYWLLLFSIFLACTDEAEVPSLGLDYFPISIGEYRIYDVTETTYVDKIETIEEYQLRETFYDSIDNGGDLTYLMRIERRETEEEAWESIENIAVKQTSTTLNYLEQNKTFVKMSYPVTENREWDGNLQNQDSEQLYHFEELSSDDFTFENSDHIKVVISDLQANIVERDERFEIYARGIGLVERNLIEITFCLQGCTEVNERENGRILVQRMIEHGPE